MKQTHSGSGDNIGGDKKVRHINMGDGSTYIENQNSNNDAKKGGSVTKSSERVASNTPSNGYPDTSIGLVAHILNLLPRPIKYLAALVVLLGVGYVGYHYYMSKTSATKEVPVIQSETVKTTEKVYVSGMIFIDGKAAKFDKIKRVRLRNMSGVNSVQLDAMGKYTFENVTIPRNKKLLVEITFDDDTVVPTEEISLGEVNAGDNTIYLPDLYAEQPKPAKAGKPATGWRLNVKINNQIHTGNGDNTINQK